MIGSAGDFLNFCMKPHNFFNRPRQHGWHEVEVTQVVVGDVVVNLINLQI